MRIILKIVFLATAVIWDANAVPEEMGAPIQVVTSFSMLETLVTELGGEHVQVRNLVDHNSDAHIYQSKSSDFKALIHSTGRRAKKVKNEYWQPKITSDPH